MATHALTLADGDADLTLVWSPDGSQATANNSAGRVDLTLTREDIFAIWQFSGTVLNTISDRSDDDMD
jgi:hypothetical protein